MFYGASNFEIATKKVSMKDGNAMTVGEFHTNKKINVLNLCVIESWKKTSIFSVDQNDIEKRESWLF